MHLRHGGKAGVMIALIGGLLPSHLFGLFQAASIWFIAQPLSRIRFVAAWPWRLRVLFWLERHKFAAAEWSHLKTLLGQAASSLGTGSPTWFGLHRLRTVAKQRNLPRVGQATRQGSHGSQPARQAASQFGSAQLSAVRFSSAQRSSAQLRQFSSVQLSPAQLSSAQISSDQLSSPAQPNPALLSPVQLAHLSAVMAMFCFAQCMFHYVLGRAEPVSVFDPGQVTESRPNLLLIWTRPGWVQYFSSGPGHAVRAGSSFHPGQVGPVCVFFQAGPGRLRFYFRLFSGPGRVLCIPATCSSSIALVFGLKYYSVKLRVA